MDVIKIQRWVRRIQSRRPTIDTELSPIPYGFRQKLMDYDKGARFCFRPGRIERRWEWPWPEWIGIPSRETLDEWFDMIDDWKTINMNIIDHKRVEKCIMQMIMYI